MTRDNRRRVTDQLRGEPAPSEEAARFAKP